MVAVIVMPLTVMSQLCRATRTTALSIALGNGAIGRRALTAATVASLGAPLLCLKPLLMVVRSVHTRMKTPKRMTAIQSTALSTALEPGKTGIWIARFRVAGVRTRELSLFQPLPQMAVASVSTRIWRLGPSLVKPRTAHKIVWVAGKLGKAAPLHVALLEYELVCTA